MREFYKDNVVLEDEEEIERQVKAGVLLRISRVKEILSSLEYVANQPPLFQKKREKNRKPQDGAPSTLNTLSLEKQWMISHLVSNYLNPSDTNEKNG